MNSRSQGLSDPGTFLQEFYRNYKELNYVELRALKNGEIKRRKFKPIKSLKSFAFNESWDIYFGVNPRRENTNGKKGNIQAGVGVWVDIDPQDKNIVLDISYINEVLSRLPKHLQEPTFIIFSGRGFQLYWLFDEPVNDGDAVVKVNKALCIALDGDGNALDYTRVLRLPGTINQKTGKRAEVIEYNPGKRFLLKDFDNLIEAQRLPINEWGNNESIYDEIIASIDHLTLEELKDYDLPIVEGERDATLFCFARVLFHKFKITGSELDSILIDINKRCCQPPIEPYVVKQKAKQAPNYSLKKGSKPDIYVNSMNLETQTNIILEALRESQKESPRLFRYGNQIVEVILE